jgi:hypothetical protein
MANVQKKISLRISLNVVCKIVFLLQHIIYVLQINTLLSNIFQRW